MYWVLQQGFSKSAFPDTLGNKNQISFDNYMNIKKKSSHLYIIYICMYVFIYAELQKTPNHHWPTSIFYQAQITK